MKRTKTNFKLTNEYLKVKDNKIMVKLIKKAIEKARKRAKLKAHMEWKQTKILNLDYIGK
jgi:ADP-dependent phosphofructokinase/glucokinase